ncbi:MAG: hypothetical protein KF721_13035 [Ignavibacteriaceae bacterium]|nr:hypothetical protein [Ignavibacteriaceae bacterium]
MKLKQILLISILAAIPLIIIEYLIPINPYFPKISSIITSGTLFYQSYNLLVNLITSITTIYASFFITYFIAKLLLSVYSKYKMKEYYISLSRLVASSLPSIFIGFVIIMWMPGNSLSEFVFILIIALVQVNYDSIKSIQSLPKEYLEYLTPILQNGTKAKKYLYVNGLISNILKKLIESHKYFWTMLIFFEFASGSDYGVGFLIRLSIEYWNVSMLFTSLTILLVVIFIGESALRFLFNRLFPWSNLN